MIKLGTLLLLLSSIALLSGCGGTVPEVDTAETSRTEPAKPAATPPGPTPAAPVKDAPKG